MKSADQMEICNDPTRTPEEELACEGWRAKYSLATSVPACNSSTYPKCVKDAESAAKPSFHDDLRDIMNEHQENTHQHGNNGSRMKPALFQKPGFDSLTLLNVASDPAWNSHSGYDFRSAVGHVEPWRKDADYPSSYHLDKEMMDSQEDLKDTEKELDYNLKLHYNGNSSKSVFMEDSDDIKYRQVQGKKEHPFNKTSKDYTGVVVEAGSKNGEQRNVEYEKKEKPGTKAAKSVTGTRDSKKETKTSLSGEQLDKVLDINPELKKELTMELDPT